MPPFFVKRLLYPIAMPAMITRTIVFVVTAVLCTLSLQAQDMVISEYYNIQDVNGEWTELVVVKDDLNAVDYVLTDANTGQVLRMGGPKFKDIPLWLHLRAGTIIVVWHRDIPAGIKRDIDPRDGYLEVSSRDTELFTIYLFPTAAGEISALNLADAGDVLEIVDASQAHVHALGHNKPTGAAYNAIPAPKANFDSGNVGASRSNRVTGRTLGSYGIGITKDSVVAGFNDSRGLPNRFDLARTNLGVKNINHWFWRETREPKWTSTPSVSVFSQNETSITIEWTALEDTYQQDSTTGYLILRDTLNFSSIPSGSIIDGMIITKGAKFGSAVVLDVLPTIAGNRFTDSNNITCGTNYTYRIYGYRYRKDDILATTDDTTARGRQYTELRYAQSAQITRTRPAKPLIAASKVEICPGDTLTLTTTGIGDRYEWTRDGIALSVGGTTRVVVRESGTYRLKIYQGGCAALSDEITVSLLPAPSVDITPAGPVTICMGDSIVLVTSTPAATYEWMRNGFILPGATTSRFVVRQAGDYQVRIATAAGCPGISSTVRVRMYDVKLRTVPAALNFGTLGQCKSDTTLTLEVHNDGTSNVNVTNITLPVGFGLVSPPPGFQIAAAASQTVRLAFSPSGAGNFTGSVAFSAQPCGASTSCSVRGERSSISVAVDRSQVDFGVFATCPTSDIRVDSTFRIRNSGNDTINVRVPRVDPPFYLLTSFTGPKVLAPNQDLAIQIQYRPLGGDRDRGVIQQIAFPYTSRSCSDTLRAQVQAASYVPRVKLDPTDIDLGVVLDCAASVDTVIDVVNTSLVSVTVTGVVGSGITYSGGSVVIEPKSSKQLRITIAPSGVSGPFSLSARVLYGPCGASDSVTLTGTLLRPQYTSTLPVVDFGTILLCDSSRSVSRSIAVAARGLLGLRSRIQSVDLGAPFTTDIVAGSSFGDTVAFAINFTPAAIGQFTDTLRLALGPCSTLVDVIVTGSCATKSSTVTATATYYGILPPGQFRDEQITITNSGSAPIVVLGMSGVPAPFSILSSTCVLPVTLQPGGKASITVRYTFQGYARKDTIAVRVYTGAPCADTTQLQLIGWTTPKDTLRGLEIIAPQEVVVRAGDDADIPLQLASPQPLDSAGIYSMTIKMSYDPQLFKLVSVPQSPSSSQISANETAPGNVTIQISSSNPLLASNPLLTLRGSTYVGPTRSTPIVIDTAYASGVMISGRNGKLTVVPDCDIDATTAGIGRPIILRLATERNDLLHITYSTLTDEQTTLCIVDLSGRTLAIDLPSVRPGLHEVHVPVGHFESGAYSVVFRNGRHMRTSTFIISR